jgi:hypothetical protein
MYAATHSIERVSADASQVIFAMVSGVTGSIGSKKTQKN